MTNRNYFFLFGLTIFLIPLFGANLITGPSSINSEIKPIAINEKGEILCKTRFTKNEMGGYSFMKVTYGFCIVSEDTIVQFDAKVLEDSMFTEDTIYKVREYWDAIFHAKVTANQLDEIRTEVLENAYNFSNCNADSFKIDKVYPFSVFEKNRNVKLLENEQMGLYGARSTDYYEESKIHLLYDFGKILFLKNENNYETPNLGADFDYYNPWTDEDGKEVNIGYETSKVTGILILE